MSLECNDCGSNLFNENLECAVCEMRKENDKLKEDIKDVVSTTWRFIGAYEKTNGCDIGLALKTAKYHLKNIDYVF